MVDSGIYIRGIPCQLNQQYNTNNTFHIQCAMIYDKLKEITSPRKCKDLDYKKIRWNCIPTKTYDSTGTNFWHTINNILAEQWKFGFRFVSMSRLDLYNVSTLVMCINTDLYQFQKQPFTQRYKHIYSEIVYKFYFEWNSVGINCITTKTWRFFFKKRSKIMYTSPV